MSPRSEEQLRRHSRHARAHRVGRAAVATSVVGATEPGGAAGRGPTFAGRGARPMGGRRRTAGEICRRTQRSSPGRHPARKAFERWGVRPQLPADVSSLHQPFLLSPWSNCDVPATTGRQASEHRSHSVLSPEGLTGGGNPSYLLTVQLVTLEPENADEYHT